jgi:hypothetical protein
MKTKNSFILLLTIGTLLLTLIRAVTAEENPYYCYGGYTWPGCAETGYHLYGITTTAQSANVPEASSQTAYPVNSVHVVIRAWRLGECYPLKKAKDDRPASQRTQYAWTTFTGSNQYPVNADYATSKHKAINGTSVGKFFTSWSGQHSHAYWWDGTYHKPPNCPRLPDED